MNDAAEFIQTISKNQVCVRLNASQFNTRAKRTARNRGQELCRVHSDRLLV